MESTLTAPMSRVCPIVEAGASLTNQVAEPLREIRSSADQTLERVREVANGMRDMSVRLGTLFEQIKV